MIVLDTHAWIWWISDPQQLSKTARSMIDEARVSEAIYISSISVWEVALLNQRGRLRLSMNTEEWIFRCEALPYLRFVPISNRLALKSVQLPEVFPKDPADRMIASTALSLDMPLVTRDRRLRNCGNSLETIW